MHWPWRHIAKTNDMQVNHFANTWFFKDIIKLTTAFSTNLNSNFGSLSVNKCQLIKISKLTKVCKKDSAKMSAQAWDFGQIFRSKNKFVTNLKQKLVKIVSFVNGRFLFQNLIWQATMMTNFHDKLDRSSDIEILFNCYQTTWLKVAFLIASDHCLTWWHFGNLSPEKV